MPFTGLRLRASKPLDPAYPRELKTLGSHLRKRRLDLGLLQREVAEQIGVSKDTYRLWESNATHPLPRQWPGIISFLDYQPSLAEDSFGARLRGTRLSRGLTQLAVSIILGVDPGSVSRWETRGKRPREDIEERVLHWLRGSQ
ncbi:MAG: transcriptional regulator [Candidatus Eisenbacteria bacterium]|nr:transcriptional regulator [Candidatus Eisenbacteria bacterium]